MNKPYQKALQPPASFHTYNFTFCGQEKQSILSQYKIFLESERCVLSIRRYTKSILCQNNKTCKIYLKNKIQVFMLVLKSDDSETCNQFQSLSIETRHIQIKCYHHTSIVSFQVIDSGIVLKSRKIRFTSPSPPRPQTQQHRQSFP